MSEARLRETLRNVRDAILAAGQDGTLSDTLWTLNPCPETVVDYIEAALMDGTQKPMEG